MSLKHASFLEVEQLEILPINRYQFHLRSTSEVLLPLFLGSALRGAFGHALKGTVCIMSHGDCTQCFLSERCVYPTLFETIAGRENGLLSKNNDAPRPFIFVPPIPNIDPEFLKGRNDLLRRRLLVSVGEALVFGLSLFGRAIEELPFVIHAIRLMARRGLGAERGSFVLEAVHALDANGSCEPVYTPECSRIKPHTQTTLGGLTRTRLAQLDRSSGLDQLTLSFITPTRIRTRRGVADTTEFSKLISMLSLRLSLVIGTHGKGRIDYDYKEMIEAAQQVRMEASGLRLMALERFSNRRQGKLELDGFIGNVSYVGQSIEHLLPLVAAGEFLHVGSATAFGMGRYVILD